MTTKRSKRTLAIVSDLKAGLSAKAIAERNHVSLSTVYYQAKRHGITLAASDYRRQNMLRLHQDPTFRENIRNALRRRHRDPAFCEKIREGARKSARERLKDPVFREKLRAARIGKSRRHPKTDEILDLLKQGRSAKEISIQLEVWATTVYRIARRNGIDAHPSHPLAQASN